MTQQTTHFEIRTNRNICVLIVESLERAKAHFDQRRLPPTWKIIQVDTIRYDVTPLTPEQIEDLIANHWSLSDYLNWLNDRTGPVIATATTLTTDLNHWHEMGITTAEQLAAYLDSCIELNIVDDACVSQGDDLLLQQA